MGISIDPALLDAELPRTLIESPSVSTFMPEEEASICPLLSNTNGTTTPLTLSHPLTPCLDNDSNSKDVLCNEDARVDTNSSSGSSTGIGMDMPETAATALFNKHAYQHLPHKNGIVQDNANGHCPNPNISKDAPSFVSWNWPLIRKCTFFLFMSGLFAMFAVVVAMIVMLPKSCNYKTAWYHGGVFYEIFPASFQDSNNDGVGDIRGISDRVNYLASLGIDAVRLNSIFATPNYPEDYENNMSLTDVAHTLGTAHDIHQLSKSLHLRNISLILDLPLRSFVTELESTPKLNEMIAGGAYQQMNNATSMTTLRSPIADNVITGAIRKWLELGVDGFYLKDLQYFSSDYDIVSNLGEWKRMLGTNRILIVSEIAINNLPAVKRAAALKHIDLVDVHLDASNGTKTIEERIKNVLSDELSPTEQFVWVHWSIAGVDKQRLRQPNFNANTTLAATIMQLMLPGTPSIFYGDEIALETLAGPYSDNQSEANHFRNLAIMQWPNETLKFTSTEGLAWLPETAAYAFENLNFIAKMIALRDRSPSIYNNAICKTETILPNTQIRRSHNDIIIVERVYPRRNSFVSVTNLGTKRVKMDIASLYYSGLVMLHDEQREKLYFNDFKIDPSETIVVKLDK